MAEWIPWMNEYEVKFAEIDEQHRGLFRMFNELMDAVWDGKAKDGALKEMFNFTAEYAVTHFSTEEKYMQRYGYPGYIDHKKLHDDFTAEVGNFIAMYENGGVTTESVISTISYLGNWTREHIRGSDQELGRFLSRKLEGK